MSAHLPFFSRLLALVLALTVLAPGFGWEAAGHASAETVLALKHEVLDVAGAHADLHAAEHADRHADAHAGHDHDTGCATPDPCAGNQHHCCPGHMLGHLPVYPAAAPNLPLLTGTQALAREDGTAFSSRVPQGLERPPKHDAA